MNTLSLNQIFLGALVPIATCLIALNAEADPKLRFEVTELVASGQVLVPVDINNHGVIVGGLGSEWPFQPFQYRNGLVEGLPVPLGLAVAINDAGELAVQLGPNYLIRSGVPALLQTDSGQPLYASGLNNRGVVVGSVIDGYVNGGNVFITLLGAVSWSNGVVRRLSPISPDWGSQAYDINDSGVAVGTIYAATLATYGTSTAVMFRDDQTIPLSILPGHHSSDAIAINARGDVLCHAHDSGLVRAFLVQSGAIVDLGSLPGGTSVRGNALNNLGQVVGHVEGQGPQRAFLYMDGAMRDLTEFIKPNTGWTFLTANAINDKGQIVGIGQINGGGHTAYLLTPKRDRSRAVVASPVDEARK